MKIKIPLIALLFSAAISAQAQSSSEKYQTKHEMNKQMQLIVNGLDLQGTEIVQLGQMMDKKRLQKESLLNQIDDLKKQMNQLETSSQKQIQGMLTPTEWKKYQEEIKPEIDKMNAERMERLEE